MQSRAAVLIAGATIFTGLWVSKGRTVPNLLSVVFALVAAIAGVISIRATVGDEVILEKARDALLAPDTDIYSAEFGLVMDKIKAHEFDTKALEDRRKVINFGLVLLLASWLTSVVSIFIVTTA